MAMFSVGCWCFHKVYHYKDRYKVAIPFYLFTGVFAFSRIRVGIFQYQKWINRVYLLQNGKQVCFQTKKYIVIPKEEVVDIKTISRPSEEEQVNQMMNPHFFRILIAQKEELFIPRDGIIHDKEVLPAVLNGNYITYEGQEGTVIVE